MRFLSLSLLLTATILVPLRPAAAQAGGPISLRTSNVQLTAAAALRPQASIGAEQPMLLVKDPYQHGSRKEGLALMIVGAAGIVTGLIIDEPAVTIISAGVGGLGLYLYIR
jgi:hypothetical protein